jgi:alpha-L-rhamnosidase
MGLLQKSDWKARWIGLSASANAPDTIEASMNKLLVMDTNHWVWANGSIAGDQPPGKVYFRKLIEIPANEPLERATLLLTADDSLALFINGKGAGPKINDWHQLIPVDVTGALKPGTNVIAIEANNVGKTPAGLLGRLGIIFTDGKSDTISIDGSWLSSRDKKDHWNEVDGDTKTWKPAAEVARYGDKPWDKVARQVFSPAPFFRKSFTVSKPIKRATAFASALGVYELHLNGDPVDNDVLSPGWTDYNKRVNYRGYDVTAKLRQGENVIGAILGDGWYASYLAFTGKRHYYGGDPRLLVQLEIQYEDGSSEIIGTDDSWKAAIGPIREADMLMGCVSDARADLNGWDMSGFDDASWHGAEADSGINANLVAHPGEPIRREQELATKTVTEPKPGIYVFNLGQNMVGWMRLKAKGSRGQKIVVRYAEMLNPDGTIYTDNLRGAKATDTFYLAGDGKQAYEPRFTFHGFQYVEVTGLDYKPEAADVSGIVVHSGLAQTGWFECSEPLVNKLAMNSLWGQKGNFLDVPTDCPQRDERAGWTGDAQVFMKTACFNMNAPAFYTKWLADLCEDAERTNGGFADVAPSLSVSAISGGNTGWSDAGPVCNWRMFEMYDDTEVLQRHYPALVRYMDYLAKTSKDYVRDTGAYGDWLRLSGPQKSECIGTAYYFYTAQTMEKIASALGKKADAEKYRALAANIRAVFVNNYIKADGRILDKENKTGQTFYALAFGLGLVPEEMKNEMSEQFVTQLHADKDHIATGFLGTPFILYALQKAGHPELAYKLVLNKTYPSWLQQVLWGSTTMWERWDGWRPEKGFQTPGMNSFNHYWLGCVSEWLFTQAAGIDTEDAGFKRIIFRPEIVKPGAGFSWVKARYDSIRGPITSSWKLENRRLRLEVSIPANCSATVYIPAQSMSDVTEGGKPAERAKAVKFLRMENGRAVFEIGSGDYHFVSQNVQYTASAN